MCTINELFCHMQPLSENPDRSSSMLDAWGSCGQRHSHVINEKKNVNKSIGFLMGRT